MTPTRIPHDGSACPVSPGTRVRVEFRDGIIRDEFPAGEWSSGLHDWWKHEGNAADNIILYEVLAPAILEPDWAVEGPRLAEALTDAVRGLSYASSYIPPGTASKHEYIDASLDRARTALSRIKGEEG